MMDGGKKISFGFSKLSKPKVSIISNSKDDKKTEEVQFIDCVEDKSIRIKNEEPKKPDFLVIPLPKQSNSNVKNSDLLGKIINNSVSSDKKEENVQEKPPSNVSTSLIINKVETLDEVAAREIIEDLKKVENEADEQSNFSVPLTTNPSLGEKESTLDDYEAIPVDKFGMALLRGMGWAPGKGIGKNEQVVAAKQPVLRPKGLGLGADKVIKKEETSEVNSELIKLVKGSFVRIIAGNHKDLFGEIIGFDDESGRLIVKMTLGGAIITFNEFMVQPVSKEDFNKNGRVINVKKFEEYKSKEDSKGIVDKQSQSEIFELSVKNLSQNKSLKHKSNIHRDTSESSSSSLKNETSKKSRETRHKNKGHYDSASESSDYNNDERSKSKKYRTSSKHNSSKIHKSRKSYDKFCSSSRKTIKYQDSSDDSVKKSKDKKTRVKHKREINHSSYSESSSDEECKVRKSKKYKSYRDRSPEVRGSSKHEKYRTHIKNSKDKYNSLGRNSPRNYNR